MPDQSSAATEHAILQEITAPLARLPDDPASLLRADFPAALRGYDRMAVDAYVKQVNHLLAELQATRSPEAAVRRALERVGEQISGILQRAHETAEQITSQSRAEAEDRLEQARREGAQITADAEQRLKDLDSDTDRIWAERHRIVSDTRDLAGQLVGLADSAADRFPPAEEPSAHVSPYDDQASGDQPAPQSIEASEPHQDQGDDATVAFPAVDTGPDDAPPPPGADDDEPAHHEASAYAEASGDDGAPAGTPPPVAAEEGAGGQDSTAVIPPASQAAHRRAGS
jgi:hypothetical protein